MLCLYLFVQAHICKNKKQRKKAITLRMGAWGSLKEGSGERLEVENGGESCVIVLNSRAYLKIAFTILSH